MEAWRLVLDPSGDPDWNMAVDEALLQAHIAGHSPAAVRFYSWKSTTVSLGRFQRIEGTINQDFCRSKDIALVRRPTGGRAVLHGTDLTFSFIRGAESDTIQDSYLKLGALIHKGLLDAGVPVEPFCGSSSGKRMRAVSNCFDLQTSFEVALNGRKVLGSAQLRRNAAILQQNSLCLEWPAPDNLNAFANAGIVGSVPCVRDFADTDTVIGCISAAIEELLDVKMNVSNLSESERSAADYLAVNKYQKDIWNLRGQSVSF